MKRADVRELDIEDLIRDFPIKRRYWTEKEIQALVKCYGKVETKILAEHLNKTLNSVHLKANEMGLKV